MAINKLKIFILISSDVCEMNFASVIVKIRSPSFGKHVTSSISDSISIIRAKRKPQSFISVGFILQLEGSHTVNRFEKGVVVVTLRKGICITVSDDNFGFATQSGWSNALQ
jgi:hypothetical protein